MVLNIHHQNVGGTKLTEANTYLYIKPVSQYDMQEMHITSTPVSASRLVQEASLYCSIYD